MAESTNEHGLWWILMTAIGTTLGVIWWFLWLAIKGVGIGIILLLLDKRDG